MNNWREIKRNMRSQVQDTFSVPANCYVEGNPNNLAILVDVRVQNNDLEFVGDAPGVGSVAAESLEQIPRLLFWLEHHIPIRGNVYSVDIQEAYRIDMVLDATVETIQAVATRLSFEDARKYKAPE